MRISDWSSDVCSSDLLRPRGLGLRGPRSGGEHLVEHGLCLALVGLLRERELGDQALPRLGQHPLLAGREPAVTLAAPQVAHDQIGRASGRERLCQYVEIPVVAVTLKQKQNSTL